MPICNTPFQALYNNHTHEKNALSIAFVYVCLICTYGCVGGVLHIQRKACFPLANKQSIWAKCTFLMRQPCAASKLSTSGLEIVHRSIINLNENRLCIQSGQRLADIATKKIATNKHTLSVLHYYRYSLFVLLKLCVCVR